MDQCTHEVRAEYWKKDHSGLRSETGRPVSQKAGWMRMALANKAIITGSDGSGNRRMKK